MLQAEIGSAKVTAGESPPTRGHLMPDFTLPSSDGKQVSLYDYRGRSNLALFFVGPARDSAENQWLSALAERYREISDTDSEVVIVVAESIEQAEEFRR
jgi:peroxiredoxin Q/BCP